jgi:hypothetical protein
VKISGKEFGNPYIGTCQSHGVHMFQKELTLSLQRSTGNEMCTRKNKYEDDMAITSISRPLQKESGDVNVIVGQRNIILLLREWDHLW